MNPHSLNGPLIYFLMLLLIAGCSSFPKTIALPQTGVARTPEIVFDRENGIQSVEVSVLIYNIYGLPWPILSGRREQIEQIGKIFGEMRQGGTEPDIVLLQEAFTMKSQSIVKYGGYPNVVGGPKTKDKAPKLSEDVNPDFLAGRSFWKGEKMGKWLNSGLAILSNFPILEKHTRPFKRRECAGFDCMSNKGILVAFIQIPGVPEPIAIFNTHMNSGIATSGVSTERSLTAHNLQMQEIRDFINSFPNEGGALLYGGDFNMKQDRDRLNEVRERGQQSIVRRYCTVNVGECDIRMSFDGDEPWLDTQDLQGFFDGERIKVRPIIVEALFDEPVNGKKLSDHDGYLVVYRLSWNPEDFPQ